MIKKHWTLRYLFARLRVMSFEKRHPDAPWLTAASIDLLGQLLLRTDRVLEFGSGRSTVWFAGRCAHVTSIEHDERWFSFVEKKVLQLGNVDYMLRSTATGSAVSSAYIRVLEELPDRSFDVLVNDGRLRDLVAEHGIAKLRSGGLMVLDNAERYLPNMFHVPESRLERAPEGAWIKFAEETRQWRRVWTCNGVTATLLMFKP